MYIFPDTNFFLQLKVPKELPWSEISTDREIIVIVPRAVQKEISRLKSDGSGRRSKRARSAAALLMRIAQSASENEVVREGNPRVEIRLPAPAPALRGSPGGDLDPNSTDDRIMGEVLNFQSEHPGLDVRLLTTDSDQVMSAKHVGIAFFSVPEHWYIGPEPDERDKRIEELRQRVAQLEEMEPKIEIAVFDSSRKPLDAVGLEVLDYVYRADTAIDELVAEARLRSPVAEGLDDLVGAKRPNNVVDRTVLSASAFSRFEAPTRDDVEKYRDDYNQWLQALRTFFDQLPLHLSLPSRSFKLPVILRNIGSRPADGMIVVFEAFGGAFFGVVGADLTELPFPQVPKPPRGRTVDAVLSSPIGEPFGSLSPLRSIILKSRRSLLMIRTPSIGRKIRAQHCRAVSAQSAIIFATEDRNILSICRCSSPRALFRRMPPFVSRRPHATNHSPSNWSYR